MGLLNLFKKGVEEKSDSLVRLPSGSYTVNSGGKVVVSTLPRSFPQAKLQQLTDHVLRTFREAREAELPLSELAIRYASLRLTARELRGGAIIFLAPTSLQKQ